MITPHELLVQVREMADPDGAQEFGDEVERLRAIVAHVQGNLIEDDDSEVDDAEEEAE